MRALHPRTRALPLGIGILVLSAGAASAQCDPDVDWVLHPATGDVAEIVVQDRVAWIGAAGGIIRIELDGVSGGEPVQRRLSEADGLASTAITAMATDGFGNIWVGTRERGVSVFDAQGGHLGDLTSFDELWSDKVIAIGGRGERMFVVSADDFSPQGTPEGGGFVILTVSSDGAGGFDFSPFPGTAIQVAQEVLAEETSVWFGTSGQGLWRRDESVVPAILRQELTSDDGLLSNNVKRVVRAPHFSDGRSVLYLGSGAGLQTFDPATRALDTVPGFGSANVLDVFPVGSDLWVLSEQGSVRDLFRVDLAAGAAALRIPRADCFGDTLYVPREVAIDADGRIVLGTRSVSFAVREGLDWFCPPPLGPHAPQIADLALHPDGTLYFGTGTKGPQSGSGLGVFDGTRWTSITRDDGILDPDVTEVHVWGDGTVWFGTSVSAAFGGVNRWFPDLGSLEAYHNAVQNPARRTQGRNVRAIEEDAAGNLWIAYSQGNPPGGLSAIEPPPSLRVTNYDFGVLFVGITLLRDIAFDSRGRVWCCTNNLTTEPAQLYVVDPKGTPSDLSDDVYTSYNMANEIFDLGECTAIEIDRDDRVWIAGEKGLALGRIVADGAGGRARAEWQLITPSSSQADGRNPLPYVVGKLDWDDNLWLGTESTGLVRISRDLATWTWFDQLEGCPLPDQSVTGLVMDGGARHLWVGTATGGIARIDLSAAGSGGGTGDDLDPQPFPNPWDPVRDGALGFAGIPSDAVVDLRVWTTGGELVHEALDARGEKTWNGTNVGGLLVEAGVYLVTASSEGGEVWKGKVAVLR